MLYILWLWMELSVAMKCSGTLPILGLKHHNAVHLTRIRRLIEYPTYDLTAQILQPYMKKLGEIQSSQLDKAETRFHASETNSTGQRERL